MANKEENKVSTVKISAFSDIPYNMVSNEIEGESKNIQAELTEIRQFYEIYKKGSEFTVEGTNGDYIAANLRYKMAASLINKEARFLFAETPDIIVDAKGDIGKVTQETKDMLTSYQDLIDTILTKNNFEDALLKAAKDCFIGKRVALLVNFNEETGVTVTFLPAVNFVYETKVNDKKTIEKFVAFEVVRSRSSLMDKRIFKKKYTLENGQVYLEEGMYDGRGALVEEITPKQTVLLTRIPAFVFINDGLTNDKQGESEIEILNDFESYYSKLSNGDMDAARKSMNPIRYTVDMDVASTKNLSTSPGSYWDLQSDQNLDNNHAQVGELKSSLEYSSSLKTTLDRIKTTAYEQVDMPNITLESMSGVVTSGKALKSIYWPLITRCKEKMKTWAPGLKYMVDIIIEGALAYPNCIEQYTDYQLSPVGYEVNVENNYPLPEDESEEKANDLAEVAAQTMSKKAYMKKWRGLTDDEAMEELEQMALERQILEDAAFEGETDSEDDIDEDVNTGEEVENIDNVVEDVADEEVVEQ